MLLHGYARMQEGSLAEAVAALSRASILNPEEIDAWNLLGEAQRILGRPEQAVRTLQHAISIDPSSPIVHFLLGEAYRDLGNFVLALAAYAEAVRLEPTQAPAWYGMGMVLIRTGRKEELAKVMQTLHTLDGNLAKRLALLQ